MLILLNKSYSFEGLQTLKMRDWLAENALFSAYGLLELK